MHKYHVVSIRIAPLLYIPLSNGTSQFLAIHRTAPKSRAELYDGLILTQSGRTDAVMLPGQHILRRDGVELTVTLYRHELDISFIIFTSIRNEDARHHRDLEI
jgi:hypothetical protein